MKTPRELIEESQQQLAEHKVWLAQRIAEIPADVGMEGAKTLLIAQVADVVCKVVSVTHGKVRVVWDYPDELYAFLRSDQSSQVLRESVDGGHVVTPGPAFSVERGPDGV